MKLSLVVMSQGKAAGTVIPINLSQFLIGRDPQCHLRPASPLISKRHCAVLVKGGKVYLRDFGSTNGTFINDEPVKGERQMQPGDVLKVGPLLFRVQVETSAPVDKATPPPPQVKQPTGEAAGDDESIAAMLLSLQDESGESALGDAQAREEDIPSGTTVMDVPNLPPDKAAGPEAGADKKPGSDGKEKKPGSSTSSAAAAALLAKYSRRPRS